MVNLCSRPSTLLLVWLVLAFGAASTTALQAGAAGPRSRTHLPRRREPSRSRYIPMARASGGESSFAPDGFLSELRSAFFSDSRDSMNSSSRRDSSDRLELLWWPMLAAVLALASTAIAPSLQGLFQSYSVCLTTHPLLTKVLTGAVLATLGDALAQAGETTKPYDSRRAASFAAFDSCYRMFQHIMFPLIIGNCRGRVLVGLISAIPGVAARSMEGMLPVLAVSERVLAYQMMVVPLLYYPVFFTFTGFMQGLTIKETYQRAVANFLPCWKRNLLFWIPIQVQYLKSGDVVWSSYTSLELANSFWISVQAVMFGFVPEKFQVVFTCLMGIIWSLILSITAGQAKTDE